MNSKSPVYLRLWDLIFFPVSFFLSLRPVIDHDVFWHLGVGRFIWQEKQIPMKDIFSFTMPDYPYVYHSWLTDLLLFAFHKFAGLWGVTLFYGFFLAGGFLLLAKIAQRRMSIKSLYFLIFGFVPLGVWIVGMRTQVVTFFFLSLVFFLFENSVWNNRLTVWLFPLLFMLWANLHGGFILGLLFFLYLAVSYSWNIVNSNKLPGGKKKTLLRMSAFMILTSFATLLTPYGWRSYSQALLMATNEFSLKFNIDWLPLFSGEHRAVILGGLLYILVLAVTFLGKKISRKEKFLLLSFFFLALKTKRFVMPLLVVLLPAVLIQIDRFAEKQRKTDLVTRLPLFISLVATVLAIFGLTFNQYLEIFRAYASEEFYATKLHAEFHYPLGALRYLKKQPIPGRMLNDFNWGGYLIWYFPDQRFFIDGRMDNFFKDGESFAISYWQLITLRPGWQSVLEKYDISSVLAPVENRLSWPLVEALKLRQDWKPVYQDGVSIILVKAKQ